MRTLEGNYHLADNVMRKEKISQIETKAKAKSKSTIGMMDWSFGSKILAGARQTITCKAFFHEKVKVLKFSATTKKQLFV